MRTKSLYYITHIGNLPSIIKHGILSHESVEAENVQGISMLSRKVDKKENIKRKSRIVPEIPKKNLLHYANLFFQPRNPMMYRAIFENGKEKLAVLEIANTILEEPRVVITDGNAINETTQFYVLSEKTKISQQQWTIIKNEWWKECDGSKRKIMAECLVPDYVKPEYIRSVIVADDKTINRVRGLVDNLQLPVIPQPHLFFQPQRRIRIGDNIELVDGGDIFFSELQTLAVTVNLQGVMGKGLALRAREQFSDVYVEYEKACRAKKITSSRPYLYKREASVVDELTDLKPNKPIKNPVKWFLLFATKRHWRTPSRLEDIENGLKWIQKNFQKAKFESLAMPALGCALGGLNWTEVAPLMCKYLHEIRIPIEIYLPREYPIEEQYLTKSYLLRGQLSLFQKEKQNE